MAYEDFEDTEARPAVDIRSAEDASIPVRAQPTQGRIPEGWTLHQPQTAKAPPIPEGWTPYQPPQQAQAPPIPEGWTPYKPKEEEDPGIISSAARGFLHGLGPMATGALGGAAVGSIVPGIGTFAGGLIGGVLGGLGGSYAQEKAIEKLAPEEAEAFRRAQEAHPYATTIGGLAAGLPYAGVRVAGTLAQQLGTRAIMGGAGAGVDAAQQLAIEHKLDPTQVILSGFGQAAIAGRPTRLGRALGMPDHVPSAAAAPAEREIPPAVPPAQGYLPGIGGGERQPTLPLGEPVPRPPVEPTGRERQGELPLEPEPTIATRGRPDEPGYQPFEPAGVAPGTPRISEPGAGYGEGQYGFNITAPEATRPPEDLATRMRERDPTLGEGDFWNRPAMPDSGGVSKAAAPPPKVADDFWVKAGQPDRAGEPHSSERFAKEAAARTGAGGESGINVLQPGEPEPTLNFGARFREQEAAAAQAAQPPPEAPAPPGPAGERLNRDFPIPPRAPETEPLVPPGDFVPRGRRGPPPPEEPGTQGVMRVPEPPQPEGTTRLYRGAGQPIREFTTDRATAERYGKVSYVDVTGAEAQQFKPGRMEGYFTTDNPMFQRPAGTQVGVGRTSPEGVPEMYRTAGRARELPTGEMLTEPVRPEAPRPEPSTVKEATPDIDAAIGRTTGEKPPVAPAAEPVRPAAAMDARTASRVLNQPRFARTEAARRGMTPEALRAQAQETLRAGREATPAAAKETPKPKPPPVELGEPGTEVPPWSKTDKNISSGDMQRLQDSFQRNTKDGLGVNPVRSTTLGKLLEEMDFSHLGTVPKAVAKLTHSILKSLVGNVPVHIITPDDMRRYHGVSKGKPMPEGTWVDAVNRRTGKSVGDFIIAHTDAIKDPRGFAHTILHEGTHAAMHHKLEANPNVKRAVTELLRATKAAYKGEEWHYGLSKDAHEFLSEAFSNPKFQELLSKIPVNDPTGRLAAIGPKGAIRTVWDAFINTVRQALGLPPGSMSMLEAATRVGTRVTELKDTTGFKRPLETIRAVEKEQRSEPPKAPGRVRTMDGSVFTGKDMATAAANARDAGYRPHQIFDKQGRIYEPPKAAPSAKAAAAEAPKAEAPAGKAGEAAAAPEEGVKSALEPAMKSDLQTGLLATIRRQFGGLLFEGSQSKRIATTALKEAAGPLARLRDQTLNRFTNEMHRLANGMDKPAFERFVDAYENNRISTLPPDQQRLAQVLKKNYDDFWREIEKLPGAEKMEAVKDYLTHMYKNPEAVQKFANEFYGASGGSLKKRTHPTFADARKAGLEAFSQNPIEHFVRYSEGISHHLAQRRMMADLENQNRIGYFSPKAIGASGAKEPQILRQPPEGYAEIKTPWAQKGGRQAFAPRDIAETINQFHSSGLRRKETKDIYEFLQHTKNMWTAVELGLSAYHGTTMVVESMASGMARSMQIASRGDFAGAVKAFVGTPLEPITSAITGRTGRQIYRDTTGTVGTPLQRKIIDTLTRANVQPGNLRITGEYDMSRLGNLWDAYKRGSLMNEIANSFSPEAIKKSYGLSVPAGTFSLARRAVQTISKPLFEHYIPALKLGTMMKDMEAWMHANPNATDAETLKYAERVANSVDNRMGEMNYDNVFMNQTAKQLGMLGLRSFGFTVGGPMREIGVGLGAGVKAIAQRRNPLDDPRTAYAMAFLPTIGAISAVYQYMRTGEGPSDLRDLVTPKTGGTVKSVGKDVPERILVPGYHKDFLGYFVNPAGPMHELEAKMAAPWTAIKEQITGEDWRGKPYVPPRATALEWAKAHGEALGSHMLPIGPKQLYEGTRKGSALTTGEQMLGIRTPGAYMLNPKGLEAYLTKKQQQDWRAQEKSDNRKRQEQGLPPLAPRQLPKAAGG